MKYVNFAVIASLTENFPISAMLSSLVPSGALYSNISCLDHSDSLTYYYIIIVFYYIVGVV